jgi:hypothetical protein
MEDIITILAQYGPLGLWTASLLWMNWQMQKERKQYEKEAKQTLAYHQENIVTKLIEQEHMLERAMEKIDGGLTTMREKYAEERIYRMRNKE